MVHVYILSHSVALAKDVLEDRNINIISQFADVSKVFEDFRFVMQIRVDIDALKQHQNI